MRVTFQTIDRVAVVGDFDAPEGSEKAVVLLHMMPAVRASYLPLTKELNKAGFTTLAIDLRGHGESTDQNGTAIDFHKFAAAQHQASRLDVDAALNFLKQKGFEEKNISVVGASIGANLALDALYRYKEMPRAVLLSPGLDYHGVTAETAIKGLSKGQKVWLVSSHEDSYSEETVQALGKLNAAQTKVTIFPGPDHGTDLFQFEPTLIPDIVTFLGQK